MASILSEEKQIGMELEEEKEVKWDDLNLPNFKELINGISLLHWEKPLPVQVKTLPVVLKEPYKNLIAQAPTGKGKTGAFAIAMISRSDPGLQEPQAICIAPTREIAVQTADRTLTPLGNPLGLTVFKAVKDADDAGPIKAQLIVGTPGTLKGMIKDKKLNLSNIKVVVIDEADTMVEKDTAQARGSGNRGGRSGGGHTNSMTKTVLDITQAIERATNGNLQKLLFSATFDNQALTYARKIAPDAHELLTQAEDDQRPVENVEQFVFHCSNAEQKLKVLSKFVSFLNIGSAIIFTNRKVDADYVHKFLSDQGFTAEVTHGGKEAGVRDDVIERFRENKFNFLVATSVLARGLDVPQVNFVVNLDLPRSENKKPDSREFIHRVGRAGRVDRKGVAIGFTDAQFDKQEDFDYLTQRYKGAVKFKEIDATNEGLVMDEIFKLQDLEKQTKDALHS